MPVILFVAILILLLGLPLAGVGLFGLDISRYLEFPPVTSYLDQAGFSWPVFVFLSLFIAACLCPFVFQAIRAAPPASSAKSRRETFPWWGRAGLVLGLAAWCLAWTRFSWFAFAQQFTFPFIWFGYILTVNAWTRRRTGSCLLTRSPLKFLFLFALSAVFWWFFEYLNRFVQNWYYVGVEGFSPLEYAAYATLSFSTVLPAVLGTRELLSSTGWFQSVFGSWIALDPGRPRLLAGTALGLACLGLAGIGIYPDYLFPLLWVSPLIILVALLTLFGRDHVLSPIKYGDWSGFMTSACAALVCGFFWEMWNFFSLAKWEYSIPFVERFHLFEMPILGYAGYLPFGLECAQVAQTFTSGGITDNRLSGFRPPPE
ncbi:MAG: hypothetical protein ACOC9D_04045 [Thermodesulfobacteriota bacterium]